MRLPDQHFADGLLTFSRLCLLSVSIDQLDLADVPTAHLGSIHTFTRNAISYLIL